jgi:uncharacterized protein (DUF1501 family)
MTSTKKDPVLVVLQLSGGNDALNTIIPYGDPLYFDNRPNVRVPEGQVLPINDYIGFNPVMGPIKKLYEEGKVAIIQGVGYPHPNRSHFRSMDIWHTCEPDKVGDEGWLGRAIRDLDPNQAIRSITPLSGVMADSIARRPCPRLRRRAARSMQSAGQSAGGPGLGR